MNLAFPFISSNIGINGIQMEINTLRSVQTFAGYISSPMYFLQWDLLYLDCDHYNMYKSLKLDQNSTMLLSRVHLRISRKWFW